MTNELRQLIDTSKEALKEIDRLCYVAECVDDGISSEMRRLWKIQKQLKEAIAEAELCIT